MHGTAWDSGNERSSTGKKNVKYKSVLFPNGQKIKLTFRSIYRFPCLNYVHVDEQGRIGNFIVWCGGGGGAKDYMHAHHTHITSKKGEVPLRPKCIGPGSSRVLNAISFYLSLLLSILIPEYKTPIIDQNLQGRACCLPPPPPPIRHRVKRISTEIRCWSHKKDSAIITRAARHISSNKL